MKILFDCTNPVKSTRRFGAGILRSLPVHKVDRLPGDAEFSAQDTRRYDATREQWLEALENGQIEGPEPELDPNRIIRIGEPGFSELLDRLQAALIPALERMRDAKEREGVFPPHGYPAQENW
jgi:hypothetical protein